MSRHRVRTLPLVAAAVLVGLTACAAGSGSSGAHAGNDVTASSSTEVIGPSSAPLPASEVRRLAAALPHRTTHPMPTTRLATGLTPPTNRWFSGLVFGDTPQPVFPLPLAFGLSDQAFGFGLPHVVTSATSIVGSHQQDLSVSVDGTADQVVSAYDDASFTLAAVQSGGGVLGRTTVAEGSPFVSHVASTKESLATSVTWIAGHGFWTATTSGGTYGLRVSHGTVDGQSIALDSGGSAVFFPVPAGHDPSQLASLATPLASTSTTYDVGDAQVSSALSYGGRETAFVTMPVQAAHLGGDVTCDLGSFPSVYGDLRLCRGKSLTWSVPRQRATAGLDLSGLSADDRATLSRQVAEDVTHSASPPADTYFGGKWLYRQAQLLEIADQVGNRDAAAGAAQALTQALVAWTDPHGCRERSAQCFVYDPTWKGVVGQAPSFGSDEFNDHHFHYGYFLYAAGVLAQQDPAIVDRLRPVMDLLAADIASGSDTGMTPRLRAYDVYAGHSWASGTAPFADGNNQESSSEAVTAWAGLSLWASATKDDALAREAAWLQSGEAASARAYWTQPDVPHGFDHRVFGINWGGKRDYATWFSPEPSAVLGIQLIPLSPSSSYLAGDPARIEENVAEATASSGDTGPLSDYVLMYTALAGESQAKDALSETQKLPASAIDDADSRSYLMAFLMSHAG
jgi:endoglucanase Acf2